MFYYFERTQQLINTMSLSLLLEASLKHRRGPSHACPLVKRSLLMISAQALELSSLADKSNQIADQQGALVELKGEVEKLQELSTGM